MTHSLSSDDIKTIITIEKKAFPRKYRWYTTFRTIDDFLRYTGCCKEDELEIEIHGQAYMIYSVFCNDRIYINDLASIGSATDAVFLILVFLKKYKGYTVECDARKTTSYPFIKDLEKRGKIIIASDTKSDMYSDERNVVFKIKED